MKPHHTTLESYNKGIRNKKPIWSDETEGAFKTIQIAISECATLNFTDDTASITLQTDASVNRMGAY